MSGRQYLGVAEVAARYGVSKATVYEWKRLDAIPYRKLGGRKQLLFLVSDLDLFDDGCCELERKRVKGGWIVRPKPAA